MKKNINIFLVVVFSFLGLIMVTSKLDAQTTGTITAPSCIIPLGQSFCMSSLSWYTAPFVPYISNSIFVTMGDTGTIATADNSTGTSPCTASNPCISAPITYPSVVFRLYYTYYANEFDPGSPVLISQATATATCASGSTWNGSICAGPSSSIVVTVYATPTKVAYGGTSKITWTSTNATSCTRNDTGKILTDTAGNLITSDLINGFNVGPLYSPTTFNITCTNNTVPILTPPNATNISDTNAILSSFVDSDGGSPVTARGTCWDIINGNQNTNCSIVAGTTGPFSGLSSGTMPWNTRIYYRGYATNAIGTGYSIVRNFFTNTPPPAVPTVTSPTATSIAQTTATIGANVTSLGAPATISARGMCYAKYPIPDINCASAGGTTLGTFTRNVTGLMRNTTYYYRGYATNATGSGYSVDGTFRTAP
jgi:hypothetical protein